jgi:hypothetical protein
MTGTVSMVGVAQSLERILGAIQLGFSRIGLEDQENLAVSRAYGANPAGVVSAVMRNRVFVFNWPIAPSEKASRNSEEGGQRSVFGWWLILN